MNAMEYMYLPMINLDQKAECIASTQRLKECVSTVMHCASKSIYIYSGYFSGRKIAVFIFNP